MKSSLKNFFNLFIDSSEPTRVHSKGVTIVIVIYGLLLLVWIMGQIGIFNKPINSFIRTYLTGLLVLVTVINTLTSIKKKN